TAGGLTLFHHTDPRPAGRESVDKRPRWSARFHRNRTRCRAAHLKQCEAPRGPWKAAFPLPNTLTIHCARLEKLLMQIDTDILSLHGLSSSHGPEHACLEPRHYLRRRDWATALSSDQNSLNSQSHKISAN